MPDSKKRVLVYGSLAYDRIMNFPGLFSEHLMPEKLHSLSVSFLIDTITEHFGGTAGNIAYNLALLREQPIILGAAGSDFERYRVWLTEHGVDLSLVRVSENVPTAAAYITTDKADNQIAAFHPGAGGTPLFSPSSTLPNNALLLIAPGNATDMALAPHLARNAGMTYFFDPGQQLTALSPDELRSGIEGAEALFVNDYELELVKQKSGWSEAELLGHTKVLVVTLGAQGSRIVTVGGEERVAAVPVQNIVDPTGAGDAYRAGFLAGFLEGLPFQTCAKIAGTVAAYAVERQGTQEHSFTLPELGERYAHAYGEPLPLSALVR